jgi:hypothetical protein
MKKIVLPMILALLIAVPASADQKQVVRTLKNCGSEASNSFGKHRENPAVDEGNGFVSFGTDESDASGTKERFTLVNCATRKLVQLKAEYLLKDSSKGLPPHGDLFAFIDALRAKKHLANADLLIKNASRGGYETIKGQLAKAYTEKAKRGDCGCALYYPETMP